MQFCVPCLLGLEKLVADELKKLNLQDVRAENGRILCRGTEADIPRMNINLRTGARVLLVLSTFKAFTFEDLFQGVKAIPWEDMIPADGEFPVKGYSINSQLHSVPACQSIVKKAISTRLSEKYHTEWLAETGKRYQIRFSIMHDEVMVCLD
ncbi:MAG: class I SAM-dependent RNA methyltransferase, partial [Oscillospiraceae bacterium]|nr:class I SAM-dependent RNA methyltransferase [Oscillospiraceae bacterium]